MAVGKTKYPTMDAALDGYIGQAMSPDQMIQALVALWGGNTAPPPEAPIASSPVPPPVSGLTLPTIPQDLLGPINPAQGPMSPPPQFMFGPAGEPPAAAALAPTMGQITGETASPWDNIWAAYKKTWTDPQDGRGIIPRSDQQSGLVNTLAGLGNDIINAPQNALYIGNQLLGPPAAGLWDWLFTPEAVVKEREAKANASPVDGFRPGIPGQGGATPGLVNKINKVESGGKATAKNPNSSAYGPGQFLKSTWMQFIKEVHPELATAGKMTEKELLELRSDPAMSDEATAWYAGKAVDVLDSIDKPATDANIYLHHFLGPGGVKALLTADPDTPVSKLLDASVIKANQSVLGGARTAQDVIDWANAQMGDYSLQPYTPGAPPPTRPSVVMPDLSAMEGWLDKMAPPPLDPQRLRQVMFDNTLAGFGHALGQVNAERAGGGALFGALAAGTSSGVAAGRQAQINYETYQQEQEQKYASLRADFEQQKATANASAANTNAQSRYLDEVDLYNWAENNRNQTEARNLLISQEAAKREADAKLASSPKIVNASAQGVIIQNPDGTLTMQGWDKNDMWAQAEKMGKVLGMDSTTMRQFKYGQMVSNNADLISIEMEIIRDLVEDGLGPAVWGEGWSRALEVAEDQLPGGLAADPKLQMEEQKKAVMGFLLGASQQAGDFSWIIQAAQLGHPGAMMLVQGGSLPNGEQ